MKRITVVFILIIVFGISACALEENKEPIPVITGSLNTPFVENTDEKATPVATIKSMNKFNEDEITRASEIAEQYLKGLKEKSDGALEYSDLRFNPADPMRDSYRAGINSENIIVFRVDINVIKAWDGFDAMKYTDWGIIVTREDIDSSWEFTDAGY